MGYFDDILAEAGIPPAGGSAAQSTPRTSSRSGMFDDILAEADLTPEPEEPGFGTKLLHGVGAVVGAPKAAIDWLGRKGAEVIVGKQPEGTTVGQMARAAAGLSPGADYRNDQSYARRLLGKGVEFGTDVIEDPLTVGTMGAGEAPAILRALGKPIAEAIPVLGRTLPNISKVATPAFTGLMTAGAIEEGGEALRRYREDGGFTPGVAESAFGAALSGAGAYAGARHLAGERGIERAPAAEIDRPIELEPAASVIEAPLTPLDPAAARYVQARTAQGPFGLAEAEAPSVESAASGPDPSMERYQRMYEARKARLDGPMPTVEAQPDLPPLAVEMAPDAPAAATVVEPPAQPKPIPEAERQPQPLPSATEKEFAAAREIVRGGGDRKALVDGLGISNSRAGKLLKRIQAEPEPAAASPLEPLPDSAPQPLVEGGQAVPAESGPPAGALVPEIPPGPAGVEAGRVPPLPAPAETAGPAGVVPEAPSIDVGKMNPPIPEAAPRGPDRRVEAIPVELDQRLAERRAAVAKELNLPETDPLVNRVANAEHETRTDALTGIGNRKHWDELRGTIHPENDHAMVMDLKRFKPINDKYGHAAGDQILQHVANVLREHFGPDTARFGGDEFGGVFRKLSREQVDARVEMLREDLRKHTIRVRDPKTGEVVDVPAIEAHIGVARGPESVAQADTAANVAAEPSRAGGRGTEVPAIDLPRTEPGAAELPGQGLGDRPEPQALVAPAAPRRPIRPIKILPKGFQLLKDQALAAGVEPGRVDRLMESMGGRETLKNHLRAQAVAGASGGKVVVLPEGETKLPTTEGALFDATKEAPRRPELEAAQVAAIEQAPPEAVQPFVDAALAAEAAGAKRTRAQGQRAAARAAQRSRSRAAVDEAMAATRESGRRPRGPADERADAADLGAVTVGKVRVANPDPQMADVAKRLAERTQTFVPAVEAVLARAAKRLGVDAKLHSLTLDANIDANVSPDGSVRSNLMAAVQTALEKAAAHGDSLGPAARGRLISREVARHVLNPIVHELAHRKADALAAADPAFAAKLDAGGHGPGFTDTLREAYRSLSGERTRLRRHLETALDSDGGRVRSSLEKLWPELEPHWRRLDAERIEREGKGKPPGDVRGDDRGGPAEAVLGGGRGGAEGRPAGGDSGGVQPGGALRPGDGGPAGDLAGPTAPGEPPGSVKERARTPRAAESGKLPVAPPAAEPVKAPTFWEKVREFWKSGLVSGPGTQVANAAGNIGEQGFRVGETFTAGLVDRLLPGERQRFSGEAAAELRGGLSRVVPALGDLGGEIRDALKLAPEKVDPNRPAEYQGGAIGGKAGRAVRIPFRLLTGFDGFFKDTGGGGELGKLSYRKAHAELGPRASGEAVRARAEQIQAETADGQHPEIRERVEKARLERTYQNEPPKLIRDLEDLRSKHSWMHVPLPFLTTPGNIGRLALERSPFGFIKAKRAYSAWRAAVAKGAEPSTIASLRGEAVDAIARPLLGTTLMAGFGLVAKAGGMTGGGPADPKEKKALLDSGWQPYSFVATGADGKRTYIPFNRFEPVSTMLGAAADIAETTDQKTAGDIFDHVAGPLFSNLMNKTFLQGLADATAVLHDPKRAASSYATSLVGSLTPNIISKAAQAIDPTIRDTTGEDTGLLGFGEKLLNTVKADLQGLSSTLPAKTGVSGEDATRPGNAVSRFLSPVQISSDKEGADLSRKLVELGAVPGPISRDFTIPNSHGKKIRLTDEEMSTLEDSNRIATNYLQRLMASPRFQALDPDEQKRQVQLVYSRARELQRGKLASSRDFRRRALATVRERAIA